MTNNLLHPLVVEMLSVLEQELAVLDIDYYVIGAVARDIHLSAKETNISNRATNDIDLAVWVGSEAVYAAMKKRLLETKLFMADATEAIKFFYRDSLEVDILPFGNIENKNREVTLHDPRLFSMDMLGFSELTAYLQPVSVEGASFKIVSIEGLVLLKLFAYRDRPSRTKDIEDIEHILHAYFDLCENTIYTDHMNLMELYDTQDPLYLPQISGRVIGRRIREILGNNMPLREKIKDVLLGRPSAQWQALLDGLQDTTV